MTHDPSSSSPAESTDVGGVGHFAHHRWGARGSGCRDRPYEFAHPTDMGRGGQLMGAEAWTPAAGNDGHSWAQRQASKRRRSIGRAERTRRSGRATILAR